MDQPDHVVGKQGVSDIARTSYAANDQLIEPIHIVMDANAYLLEYHYPTTRDQPLTHPAPYMVGANVNRRCESWVRRGRH
jgi:hypothetical protein